jgi:hypothetical protein
VCGGSHWKTVAPLFSLFFQEKAAARSPKAAEFIDSRIPDQRNNSDKFRCSPL